MKKLLLLIALTLVVLSCGARKKNKSTSKEDTSIAQSTAITQHNIVESNSTSNFNYNQYLSDMGLKITSKGSEFHFQIGDLKFAGNADIDFSQKKEESKVSAEHKVHTNYQSVITYWSHITYKTQTIYRTIDVEAKKPSFWLFVLLYFAGLITIPLIKLILKK